MRYLEWDYERRVVTEYVRHNECNGCGECCMTVISLRINKSHFLADGREENERTNGQGIWMEVQNDDGRRYIIGINNIKEVGAHRCPELDDEKRCKVHLIKPTVCREWPFNPAQVSPFPSCSYSFSVVTEYDMDNLPADLELPEVPEPELPGKLIDLRQIESPTDNG